MVQRTRVREGFTLVELLVVIGIIAVLVGILIPVVSRVRTSGYIADSKNWLGQISGAIERYHTDFKAYPGPINNANIASTGAPAISVATGVTGFDAIPFSVAKITMSENLTLGLLGGLTLNGSNVQYNPSQVGLGPMNLNSANPKRYPAYLETNNLSWKSDGTTKNGHYQDDGAAADDTVIPEFVDRFPEPMPILYLRSRLGVDSITTGATNTNNSVVTYDAGRAGAYDLSQIIGYTGTPIGTGKEIKAGDYAGGTYPQHGLQSVGVTKSLDKSNATNYQYPYDAYPYFQSPNQVGVPRQKDGYILIAPGRDRVYGTSDDICNFGEVNP